MIFQPIPESTPNIGELPVTLYSNDDNFYPVRLPYKIESDIEVTIDLSQVKDVWETGMMDDLRNACRSFFQTPDFELVTIGI